MPDLRTIIEILKATKEIRDNFQTIEKLKKGVELGVRGKDPFPPPKKVQEMISQNERMTRRLTEIKLHGVPAPKDPQISADELLNPGSRSRGLDKFRRTLKVRKQHATETDQFIRELDSIKTEAAAKQKAALILKKTFLDLAKSPLPDIGTVGKTTYWTWSEMFGKVGASLGNLSRAAPNARTRALNDLANYKKDTSTMEQNLQLFGVVR